MDFKGKCNYRYVSYVLQHKHKMFLPILPSKDFSTLVDNTSCWSPSVLPLMFFFFSPLISGPSRNKEVMEQVDISTWLQKESTKWEHNLQLWTNGFPHQHHKCSHERGTCPPSQYKTYTRDPQWTPEFTRLCKKWLYFWKLHAFFWTRAVQQRRGVPEWLWALWWRQTHSTCWRRKRDSDVKRGGEEAKGWERFLESI